jgi:hypothetical protein
MNTAAEYAEMLILYGEYGIRFPHPIDSRQFPILLKVTIAQEIFTHNKTYFIRCRKKKLFAFPDLDSIRLLTCLWRNYPIFGYFKSRCHF